MDQLINALAPVFAAGLGIQQFGEIFSPVLDKISPDNKKIVMGLLSLILGLMVAFQFELHVINLLFIGPATTNAPHQHPTIDGLVTGLIISGGTEGINSILKFLKYKKEETKNDAAKKLPESANATAGGVPAPTEPALANINKK